MQRRVPQLVYTNKIGDCLFIYFFIFFCAGNNQNARAGSGEGSWEVWRVWRVDMKELSGGEVGRGAMGKGRLGGNNGEWEEGNEEGEIGRGQQGGGDREGETGSGRLGVG